MSDQLQRQLNRQTPPGAAGGDPLQPPPGNLPAQAAAFARVARESTEECARGTDAVQELQSRRQGPGQ